MTRTYIPTLRFFLNQLHRYATAHQTTLQVYLTTEQAACLLAVINAIAECLAVLGEPVVGE